MTKLSCLECGQTVRVVSIEEGNIGRRLVEMGVYPGRSISMIRRAPFSDPIEFSVGESCLSLRESEAAMVSVEEV